ncbi:hypothetical protein [Halorubrum distributum]|uniref:DNA recombination and repair protein Rad51-like C-terminal domain-containing protein n=1 Tax=Halorubrum distributum TaxID=29283 RepID=A0A6B1IJI0_9EURY|nr:hypothetical protein [Halorubrum terrestre]MYL68973.1 hypothetical protein [Halorubrum terrestre]
MSTRSDRPTADLPELSSGVTLVDVDDDLGVTPVQALLLDRVLGSDGPAFWVDGANRANTTRLRELAPADRVLDRVEVARGFTAHQHTALLDRLAGRLAARASPSVVLATGLDARYRAADVDRELAGDMFVRAVASVARVARVHDAPVLVTRCRDDAFSRPLRRAAATRLTCRATPFGPRFEDAAGEAETLVYRGADGWTQTTLAYWREVLEHRARMYDSAALGRPAAATGVR